MSGRLAGRAVIVTGGGRGIGRAHALACAAEGARVLVNDVGCDAQGRGADPAVAAATAEAIRAEGGFAIAETSDAGAAGGAQQIVQRALDELGRIDGVIGAAGIVVDRFVLKMDDQLLDRMLDVHVRGGFRLVRAAARAMIDARHGGSIVLHAGPDAFFGAQRRSALAASSAAVVGLVRSAAIELRKHGIRVNALAATARTRTTEELPLFRGIAEGSMGPEHVAPAGVFLLSDLAAEVSGEVVGVAGSRIYAIHGRETPGWFGDADPVAPADIAEHWSELSRG